MYNVGEMTTLMPITDRRRNDVAIFRQGMTLWLYTTKDSAATVTSPDYFDAACPPPKAGDLIFAVTDSAGTPSHVMLEIQAKSGVVAVPMTEPVAADKARGSDAGGYWRIDLEHPERRHDPKYDLGWGSRQKVIDNALAANPGYTVLYVWKAN